MPFTLAASETTSTGLAFIRSPASRARDPMRLYRRLCALTGTRQEPCVYDGFQCAIEQARNPHLPLQECNWWYWSRIRKPEPLEF